MVNSFVIVALQTTYTMLLTYWCEDLGVIVVKVELDAVER